MTMELAEELPAMLGLFLCGAVGYVSVKYLHKRVRLGATAKLAEKLRDPFFPEVEEESIPETATPSKRQAKKKARRRFLESQELVEQQEELVTVASAKLDESSIDVSMREEVSATQEPAPMSDRVAKLLAKKAARKARKAEEIQAPIQRDSSAEPTCEAASAETIDAGNRGRHSEDHLAVADQVPSMVAHEPALVQTEIKPDLEQASLETNLEQEEETRKHWAEWTDDELPEAMKDTDTSAVSPSATASLNRELCTNSYSERESEEDWPSTAEFRPRPWERFAPGASDFERPRAHWDEEWWGPPRRQPEANEDNWMTPFDELIQGSCFRVSTPMTPASSGVCLWKGTAGSSLPCDAAETFTDGQHLYRPIQSCDGQSYYTDGLQVYAPVCVMVMSPEQQQAGSVCDNSEEFLGSEEDSWDEDEEELDQEEAEDEQS